MDCLFCKIGKKEIPSKVVYEDEHTLAFLDMHPHAPGHSVIIPKSHAENILDLKEGEVGPLFLAVKKVTSILQKNLSPKGFTIGMNHGRISGQSVDHLHVHVLPRYEGDGGGSLHGVVKNPPRESLEEMHKKLTGIK